MLSWSCSMRYGSPRNASASSRPRSSTTTGVARRDQAAAFFLRCLSVSVSLITNTSLTMFASAHTFALSCGIVTDNTIYTVHALSHVSDSVFTTRQRRETVNLYFPSLLGSLYFYSGYTHPVQEFEVVGKSLVEWQCSPWQATTTKSR